MDVLRQEDFLWFTEVCSISAILCHSSAKATVTCSGGSGEFDWDGVGGDSPYQVTCSNDADNEFTIEINHQLESRTSVSGGQYDSQVWNFWKYNSRQQYLSHATFQVLHALLSFTNRDFLMMTSSNENIFRVTGPLCGEFTGPWWIPRTKASDAELWCFLYLRPNKRLRKQRRDWWFETLSNPLWRHCNVFDIYTHPCSDLNNDSANPRGIEGMDQKLHSLDYEGVITYPCSDINDSLANFLYERGLCSQNVWCSSMQHIMTKTHNPFGYSYTMWRHETWSSLVQ